MISEARSLFGSEYYRTILDTMPNPIFVTSDEARVLDFNTKAGAMLGEERSQVLQWRIGEVLHCLHATETPEGCGCSPSCASCQIRAMVNGAIHESKTSRETVRMELKPQDGLSEALFLVTVAPLKVQETSMALVVLEDLREISILRRILPLCSSCKQVRDDENYWNTVENYLSAVEIDCTHSLCPDCTEKLSPQRQNVPF